ncbi:MAG: polysaccharide deacetylase family protein [Kineosporiaceae bacterium]|nr:polysaccharide deacetylase family protein [Kineosporiaceae bacterium]MBL8931995.1 polysaccharide deacetylase family protein [Kineosporiaceae bacterium]
MIAERPTRLLGRRALLSGFGACLLGGGTAEAVQVLRRHDHTDSENSRRRVDPTSISRVETAGDLMALTFDDGPDPDHTPTVLRVLSAAEVRATFFVIGRNALRHPQLVRDILADGHEVANHTQDHRWLDRLDLASVTDQIVGAERTLAGLGAGSGGMFRPPRGWISPNVVTATRAARLRTIFWTDCLEAHLSHGIDRAIAEVSHSARPGGILLCHDGGRLDGPNPQAIDRSATVAALPGLLRCLRARGLAADRLSSLLEASN